MRRKRRVEVHFEPRTREQLEAEFGQVWDTEQLAVDFIVTAIIDTTIVVRRKVDDEVGLLVFQPSPRFYHSFRPQPQPE